MFIAVLHVYYVALRCQLAHPKGLAKKNNPFACFTALLNLKILYDDNQPYQLHMQVNRIHARTG